MQRVIPALRTTDYARSKAFYIDGLGFRVESEHRFEPDFPVFATLIRDGMTIYLTAHQGDCQVGGLVHFVVDDVDADYAEFLCNGVAVCEPPNDDLPRLRMMTVVDPDGNQLRFFTRTETPRDSSQYSMPRR